MDANDAADHIVDVAEEDAKQKFRSRVALAIGVMAMLLAITSLGGGNAAEDMLGNNIHASDTWAFYQAKNVRQTVYKIAAEEIENDLKTHETMSPAARAALQQRLEQYNQTVSRYESEPDPKDPKNPLKGEGKKELFAQAQNYEKERDIAIRKDPNFDFAEAFFQIAIVLASVAILATSRKIVSLAIGMAAVATVLMFNGFFLFFHLPV